MGAIKALEQALTQGADASEPLPRPPSPWINEFINKHSHAKLTGWLKGHDCKIEQWATMKAERGGEQYAKAIREENEHNQTMCTFISRYDIFPEETNDKGQQLSFKTRSAKRKSMKEGLRALERFPSLELRRLVTCRPDLVRAQEIFNDGLDNACKDVTRYSEFAVHERIEGLESDDIVTAKDPGFLRLLPHQQDGIGWLEHFLRKYKGALLADEMGLGKTLQVIAVLLRQLQAARREGRKTQSLIAVTLPLLETWKSELLKASGLKVYVYYGIGNKELSATELCEYDVVLTTYDTVMHQWKKLKAVETAFRYISSGKKEVWESVNRAQEDFWYAECQSKGVAKISKPNYDVLQPIRTSAPLFTINWETIAADEAHVFRNGESMKGLALVDLKFRMRIAITGTPMQNHTSDMYSIMRFLRIQPWCNEALFKAAFVNKVQSADNKTFLNRQPEIILSGTVCSFTLRRLHTDNFENRPVSSMFRPLENIHRLRLCGAMQATQEKTKDIWDQLEVERREQAQRAKANQKRKKNANDEPEFESEITGREPGELLRQIFEARMNCVHPDLLKHAKYSENIWVNEEEYERGLIEAERLGYNLSAQDSENAATVEAIVDSYKDMDDRENNARQKNRREEFERSHRERREHFRNHLRSRYKGYTSDKIGPIKEVIRQTIADIDKQVSKMTDEVAQKTYLANSKFVVFAEYLSQLDLLEVVLQDEMGIDPLRYDGTCTSEERSCAVEEHEEVGNDFTLPYVEPSKRRVFLATKRSCAEGLNLPHTKYVIFMSPSWNPFLMDQCKGRACRLTNPNQVTVHYFFVDKSIELRMWGAMEKKREVVKGVNDINRLRKNARLYKRWRQQTFVNKLDKGLKKVKNMLTT
ncbi:hypothetical protein KC331_g853 [Hortaea werneckii]|nr:hypothetical protein KC331_g853 [Hortaea werneckii]KAI7722464.1 hypothetical protein KC353_g471 [Hortaea werneckii]